MNKEEKARLTESGVITERALLAYLRDELSPDDRQEMERLLKDDPFAQEALEGLKNAQDKVAVANSLQNIRRKVHNHTGKKEEKILRIHWTNYAWAAAILGLLISLGSIMIIYIGKKNEHEELNKEQSMNVVAPKKEEPVIIQAPASAADSASQKQTETPSPIEKEVNRTDTKSQPVTYGDAVTFKDSAKKVSKNIAQNEELTKQKADKNVVADISTERNARANNFAATKKSMPVPAAASNSYNYTVTTNTATNNGLVSNPNTSTRASKDSITISQGPAQQAMKTFYTGDYKLAEQQFDDVLKDKPQDPEALFFGGISNYVNGNLDKSEKNFDALLKQHKKFMDGSKWYKANILLKQGKKDEAKKLLQQLSESGGSYKERAQKKLVETQF